MLNLRSRLKRLFQSSHANFFEVESAEWRFYISYLTEGMIVFDVGAFLGETTLLFSHFVRSNGCVHSFEPNKLAFDRMNSVCRSFNRPNIIINHVAITDKEEEVELKVYDEEHLSWSTIANRPLHKYGINVEAPIYEKIHSTTIDHYCEKHKISQIDLLKIDVEGAEYQVLKGAKKMFEAAKVKCCSFEFGQTTIDMGNDPEEILDFFRRSGYTLRNMIKDDPIFPRDQDNNASFSMHVAFPR